MALVTQNVPQSRGDRHFFSSSDDNAMTKQILGTHAPNGREVDVKPFLHIIEDIFKRAGFGIPGFIQGTQVQFESMEDKALHSSDVSDMLEHWSYTISKISCEISCKCSGGGDAHATTVAMFNVLTSYSWDAKLVLALAAFAANYGEFWLVVQLYPTNPLAKLVAFLKQTHEMERAESLKPKFDALNILIKAMLDVTKCIVEFKELPSQYITPDTPEMVAATAHIPTAVYWTIRSIVACASQIMDLIGMGHEYIASTTEAWELSSLAHKLNNIHSRLMEQIALCHQHIEEKRHIEAFRTLMHLFDTPHLDNIKTLKALIYAEEDQLPLFDGSNNKRASIEVLRRKIVLLFITDLEISHEELSVLHQIYTESRHQQWTSESQYEVVWIPVVDKSTPWNADMQKQFDNLQGVMPWYSVFHPSQLDSAVIRYIKEVWHFTKRPLLVVLGPQGNVLNQNALHMMWIWGSIACPFTSLREETLWQEESWRIELLADSIDPVIFNWVSDGKIICLFGGEDIEWVRKFTKTARTVATAANVPIEMLYVGKSNPGEKVRKNNTIIAAENLSHHLTDLTLIWFFWVRLESMWHSKIQHGKTVENDSIMQEIMTMLSFDGSEQGWAVIGKGSGESDMAKAKGDAILNAFSNYGLWKERVVDIGFVAALIEYLNELRIPHHCNHFILPGVTGSFPEKVVCAECGRLMERFMMYRCCTD